MREQGPIIHFRRLHLLPPYPLSRIRQLTLQQRRVGMDVVDLGFGNPDLPSPPVAVRKLIDAAGKPQNHRYSSSKGIPKLRQACAEHYQRRYGVELDPETEVVTTIGAKEGLAHVLWVLLDHGDVALVPTPCYPIHEQAPRLAGATLAEYEVSADLEPAGAIRQALERAAPRQPRVLLLSYPHNPTGQTIELDQLADIVELAREHDLLVVHDFAYADIAFDGHTPPSILQVDRAVERCVELYSLTKSYSMAGWRVGFLVGNAQIVQALSKLKSWLDYGTFQPVQIAAIAALTDAADYPAELCAVYQARRDTLIRGLARAGWETPAAKGTMFVWAPIPVQYRQLGSLAFAQLLLREAQVAVSPGISFGPAGEGHLRFALVENEHRIRQATANIRRFLTSPWTPELTDPRD